MHIYFSNKYMIFISHLEFLSFRGIKNSKIL